MVTVADIDHWDVTVLQNLFTTVDESGKALKTLGENLDATHESLQDWGGQAAEEYRADHGKTRTDIEAQQTQAEDVKKLVSQAINDVQSIKSDLDVLRKAASEYGAHITDEGKVVQDTEVSGGDNTQTQALKNLQDRLDALLVRATAVDEETAAAIKAAVTPKEDRTSPAADQPTDPGSQERPGVTDVNDPDTPWATNPSAWKESAHNPNLTDNPPGYDGPAGAERDAAWKEYLSHYPQDGSGVLPNPDAVQDTGLKTLGNAADQVGTSYAWAGGDITGPGKGTVNMTYNPQTGQMEPDESGTYADNTRIGYDCSGLSQYAAFQASGLNIGGYTGLQLDSANLTDVTGAPQPGDLVYYGSGSAHHVAIYVAPGVVVEAPGSGQPVQLSFRATDTASAHELVRVRRLA